MIVNQSKTVLKSILLKKKKKVTAHEASSGKKINIYIYQ